MNYKKQYDIIERLCYAAVAVLDKAQPSATDSAAWEKYEAAERAIYDYARHVSANPYNPVVQEAYDRGDYSYFLSQLERPFPEENRKLRGWSKSQIRKAIPIIRKLAEESDGA